MREWQSLSGTKDSKDFITKSIYEQPQLLMSMLNTDLDDIKANDEFSLFKTSQGNIYSIGNNDMRESN